MNAPEAITIALVLGLSIGLSMGYVAGFVDGWASRRFLSLAHRLVRWIRA